MAYSKERRAAVIAKMPPPVGMAIPALSRQEGISEATLYKWRSEALAQGRLAPDAGEGPAGLDIARQVRRRGRDGLSERRGAGGVLPRARALP